MTFSVSVCFPAYNEEATVTGVIQEAHELLSASALDYEIIVCDDGSTDRTGELLHQLAGTVSKMKLLRNESNQGIRATFERLYREATKEFVFLNSTDQQWPTKVLFDLIPFAKEWDIIIASRRQKHYGMMRSFVSWGFNFIPWILFRVNPYDAGAVKLVRREIITKFPIVSRSPFSEAERIIRASRAGYRVMQYPVETKERAAGKAKGVRTESVLAALADVFRVWRSL